MKREKSFNHALKIIGLGGVLALSNPAHATADIGLSESLRQSLEAQGWQAEEADDGSLIYRKSSVSVKQEPAQPAMRTLGGEDLKRALEERGWQMEWSSSGSLILRPEQGSQSQPDKPTGYAMPMTEMKPVDRLPEQPGFEYWRIERQDDGSLHFHPLAEVAVTSTHSQEPSLGRCEGAEVRQAAVPLPVDQWVEAKALAQGWLNNAGLDDSQVGRIRKVLGVYLISLVDRSPPYHLMHQLAIRASDGRVILLE
ncbi:MAG: hypothetical protein ABFR65_10825 [Pseudomonadota bacterium]